MRENSGCLNIEAGQSSSESTDLVLPLLVEETAISRRRVETAVVRVATVTETRDQVVTEPLAHERIEVEHVPVGRFVGSAPPVREDGDVTIMPVMEEVMVVERRLFLKEEVHVRRVRITGRHTETVQLREQDTVVTRTPVGPRSAPPTESLPNLIQGDQNHD
jgi:uncharacterized protein (TIGR02271 family)